MLLKNKYKETYFIETHSILSYRASKKQQKSRNLKRLVHKIF